MSAEWTRWDNPNRRDYTLEDHIRECDLRYQQIDTRLGLLESKVDHISRQIDDFKTFFLKLAVKMSLGVVIALCSAVFVINRL